MTELADTSVWARKGSSPISAWFAAAVEAGEIAVCDMVVLELLHSARNLDEFERLEDALGAMPWVTIEAGDWGRARNVYRALAGRAGAFQRSVKHPDLLIAAAAERAGLAIVHYDEDYEVIASITGQPARWVAPRGSL